MQKECLYCGKIFESTAKSIYKQKARKFCSAQCASDYRMSQPEFVEKISKIQREVQNRSDVKQKNAAGVRRKWEEKEFRENTIKSQTIAQNRPDVLEKTKLRTKKIANRPENIERMRARMTDNMKNALYQQTIQKLKYKK